MSERIVTVGGNKATRLLSDYNRKVTGDEYYVDATNGDDGNNGRSVAAAVASITHALTLMTANQDDVMYLLPGHAETVSAAAGIALNVAGITIVGIGVGSLQPTITFDTATTADMDVDAANIVIENVHFIANYADVAAAIDVNADDFTLKNCRFTEKATNMNAKIWVQDGATTTSDRITIEGCYCIAPDAANTSFVALAGTGDGHIIKENTLIGDWTIAIGGAGVVTNITVLDNVISNKATDADACIKLPATTTGIVMRNLACGGHAQASGITAVACAVAENYYGVVSEDLSAILDPIAT